MLRIEHLSKAYGEKKAVDDLNLHIAPGEIYGFIGHNGAGKTTTLKSVAGILQFDQGEIYVDGKSIRTQPLECKRTFAISSGVISSASRNPARRSAICCICSFILLKLLYYVAPKIGIKSKKKVKALVFFSN